MTSATAPVTLPRLERALDTLAAIIAARGEKGLVFLPIFDRLDAARRDLAAGESRLDEIRRRAAAAREGRAAQ